MAPGQQVLAELGAVGLALLLGAFVVTTRTVRRGRAIPTPGLWAGVTAALVALAVHGLFDFSWHVPAIPLTGALLLGIVTTDDGRRSSVARRPEVAGG
jgi:Kef-type K+ transport system membrane component KefB